VESGTFSRGATRQIQEQVWQDLFAWADVHKQMRCAVYAAILIALGGCEAPVHGPMVTPLAQVQSSSRIAEDDGTYLGRIDPLGGRWRVAQIGKSDLSRYEAWVNFSAGGFLNHGAGCRGGYPAFYRLDGGGIAITRLEPIQVGECGGNSHLADGTAEARIAAGESERLLASFLDRLMTWSRQSDTLILTARDGTRATLTRPIDPHPELAGRWLIESIGGQPLVTEHRLATLRIGMGHIGAHAECNSLGAMLAIPSPGRISLTSRIISTEKGCAPEDESEDALMARAIASATAYRLAGNRLIFTGGPGMVVRRPPPPDRKLPGEYKWCGDTMLGAYHEGPITLAISGSMMRDNASCTAHYVADGPNLSLQLDGTPACGGSAPAYVAGQPVGVGGDISVLSVTRPDGFGFNEEGQLLLRTNRGLLMMCRKGAPRPFGG
jgi:heat shock protein HslJ